MINNEYKDTPSSLCTQGPDPLSMTGYFMQILMMHFSDPGNIHQPALKDYTWAPPDNASQEVRSKLLITTVSKFNANDMYQRPAIVLKRKTTTAEKDAIGGAYQGISKVEGGQQAPETNSYPNAGGHMFEYANKGQMQVVCLHKEGAAAEVLGTEVYNLLLAWIPLLSKELNLWDWLPLTLGELVRVDEAKDHWAVVVTLDYAYRTRVILRPETPMLKRIVSSQELS